jgi:hypothetical protein
MNMCGAATLPPTAGQVTGYACNEARGLTVLKYTLRKDIFFKKVYCFVGLLTMTNGVNSYVTFFQFSVG